MENVELVITPKVSDLGGNFQVRRSLPFRKKRMVGPFIFWDHMGPVELLGDKSMEVRSHPHIGLATLTWLFSGEILHRDSLGNEQTILPGQVNWMTAGKGISHSERAYEKGDAPLSLEGIQLWIALPKESEKVDPSFFHCKENEIPVKEDKGASIRLIAGEAFDMKSPVPVYSQLFYLNIEANAGYEFNFDLDQKSEGAVYVAGGIVKVGDQEYDKYNLIIFKQGTSINFTASEDAKIMVFGGEVFPEKRFIWWNFVATSEELIEDAKTRWNSREFGEVINEDADNFIPLPAD